MFKYVLNIIIGFFFFLSLNAQTVLPAPSKYVAVTDVANLLSKEEAASLTRKLQSFFENDPAKAQIVVMTIKSLEGKVLEDYATTLFNTWGIGDKEKSNGVLLLIAKNDRKIRIETGYGAESYLPDAYCADLIAYALEPKFKNRKYYEGLDTATSLMIARLKGEKAQFDGFAMRNAEEDAALFRGILYYILGTAFISLLAIVWHRRRADAKKVKWGYYIATFIIAFFCIGIVSSLAMLLVGIFYSLIIKGIISGEILFWVAMFVNLLSAFYFFQKAIIESLEGNFGTYTSFRKNNTYQKTDNTYTNSGSGGSNNSSSSNSYSDSFGGGSSGGGGASGGW